VARSAFICQCINDTLDGLQDGLSHFSGPSRAAIIYSLAFDSPMVVNDSQNLLQGHEPILRELYMESDRWRVPLPATGGRQKYGHVHPEKNLQLAGLISYGGRSNAVCYQTWVTEHHPELCAIGPTERWLEHATWRVSHDIANEEDLYTGISGNFLREYATHAVRDQIVDEMNMMLGWDTQLRVYPKDTAFS